MAPCAELAEAAAGWIIEEWGDAAEERLQKLRQEIARYGGVEIFELLMERELSNHVPFILFLWRIIEREPLPEPKAEVWEELCEEWKRKYGPEEPSGDAVEAKGENSRKAAPGATSEASGGL